MKSIIHDLLSKLEDEIAELEHVETEAKRNQLNLEYRSIFERYCCTTTKSSSVIAGDGYMDTILLYLDKLYRSPTQKEFHRYFLGSCVRAVYGDEHYKTERHRIMHKYNLPSRKQQVLVCCPRRVGKSFAVAYFAVVMCMVIPNIEISIFSPGRRQSTALMGHIFSFLKRLNEQDRVLRKNEEKLVLRTLCGHESKINAYPSAVRTLKGVSGTIVIMEELACIDPQVVYEVVVPLLQLDVTTFIGISTITTEDNLMTKYMELIDTNGDPIFEVKRMYLICPKCMENGTGASCNHNSHLLPKWSSSRKRRMINSLMKDQEELLEREIGGMASETNKAFDSKLIKTVIRTNDRWQPPFGLFRPRFVYISIDPSGGGEISDFAMASFIQIAGKYIMCGAESFPTKNAIDNHDLVLRHVHRLESIDYIGSNTTKIFIIESNLGFESQHLELFLKGKLNNFVVLREKDDRVGFITTNETKSNAVEKFRALLGSDAFAISSASSFVCVSKKNYEEMIDFFQNQMLNFTESVVKSSKIGGKTRKFYTGKAAGSKDDLVMAVLIALYNIPIFLTADRYEMYRRKL